MILAVKTDQDPVEICLTRDNGDVLAEKKWSASRTLARNLLPEIEKLLQTADSSGKLTGIVVYQGPGSFTGLRIGIAVANALAYSFAIPIVGANGDNWLADGLKKLSQSGNDKIVLPKYSTPPHITKARK